MSGPIGALGDVGAALGEELRSVLGGGAAVQQFLVWSVFSQLAGAILQPALVEIQQTIFSATPDVALSPADLADAVIRGFMTQDDAEDQANLTGISNPRFQTMIDLAGNSISPEEAAAALRRGIITAAGLGADSTSFEAAIAEGNLKDKWTDVVKALSVQIPTTADVMNAWLEGQISEQEASTRYLAAGGDPTWFQSDYNSSGSSPTPNEAGVMANRGVIPWDGTGPDAVSFQQAFLEGPWRNKWEPYWRALTQYLPPPRTVTAMLKEGSLTQTQALTLLQQHGLSADLAASYVKGALAGTSRTAKQLTEAQVVSMYEGKLLTKAQADAALTAIGYTAQDSDYLLELADLKATASTTNAAIARIQALFTSGKIDVPTATADLTKLGVDAAQVSELIAVWDLETSALLRVLTPAQWGEAYGYGVVDQATAEAGLIALGYDAIDAWILIGIYNKGPVPNPPPGAPTPPAVPA